MIENQIKTMLKEADFSRETDLRSRLRQQLFGSKIIRLDGRQLIEDDDLLEQINAAGEAIPEMPDKRTE